MRQIALLAIAAGFVVPLMASAPAQAQATRTWVSGVGDDVNPCSRTAPCKTFAGAISKTASGGEIDALDSGGFGAVTITKPITIDGNGVEASVLTTVNGIIINYTAPAIGTVTLRNLEITFSGTGTGTGVVIVAAGATQGHVVLDHVAIFGFTQRAVNMAGTTPINLDVRNCHFWNNTQTALAIVPSTTTALHAEIDSSDISNNGASAGSAGAVYAQTGGKIHVRNSTMSFNTASAAEAGSGGEVFVDDCVMGMNQFGAKTSGGTLWLSRSVIYGSTGGSAVSN